MKSYEMLRQRYTEFIYHGFTIEEENQKLKITYDFEIVGLASFHPTWKISCQDNMKWKTTTFQNMVFSLGMVELISYWKITCPPKVLISSYGLNEDQIKWWKSLYFNGLGEFYYTNGIVENENDFMEIIADHKMFCKEEPAEIDDRKCLIPIGGGKDSNVSIEILKENTDNNYCYIINQRGATTLCAKKAGFDANHTFLAERSLDPEMLRLNREGYLNGHTPFSAIVAFSATIVAYLQGIKYIVLSNESSANESTVEGSYVNHQYSKSFQFEQDFHNYEERYIGSGTYYFSLLRPLSEFQIGGYFASCTKYHDIFKSCNVGSKQDIWCGHCPKCLFVWLILSPFLSQKELGNIFGKDLLEDKELLFYFKQLIGLEAEKPFECVGSRDEINAAITIAIRDYDQSKKLPYLFDYYKTLPLYNEYLKCCDKYFSFYDNRHLIPEKYEKVLRAELKKRGILQ